MRYFVYTLRMGKLIYRYLSLTLTFTSLPVAFAQDEFFQFGGVGLQGSYRHISEVLRKEDRQALDSEVLDQDTKVSPARMKEFLGGTIRLNFAPSASVSMGGVYPIWGGVEPPRNALIGELIQSLNQNLNLTSNSTDERNRLFFDRFRLNAEAWGEGRLSDINHEKTFTAGVAVAAPLETKILSPNTNLKRFMAGQYVLNVGLFFKKTYTKLIRIVPGQGRVQRPVSFGNPVVRFTAYSANNVEHRRELTWGAYIYFDLNPLGMVYNIPGAIGQVCLKIPGTQLFVNITDLIKIFPDDVYQSFIQQAKPLPGQARVVSIEDNILGEHFSRIAENYISEDVIQKATPVLMGFATAGSYGLEARHWLRALSTYWAGLRASAPGATALAKTAGTKILAIGDILVAGMDMLSTESTIEWISAGRVSVATRLRETLSTRELVETSNTLLNYVGYEPGRVSHEDLLQILQDAREDENLPQAGRQEAASYISLTPSLRYLDHLEQFAKTQGISAIYGLKPHEIAEAIVQKNPAALSTLENVYGLVRDSLDLRVPSAWSIDATQVDYGPHQPVENPGTLISNLMDAFRSSQVIEAREKRLVFKTLLGTQNFLGTNLQPIVWSKR